MSVKSPWDPDGFKVKEVKGSKVILQRGEEIKIRAKNNVKVVKKRPKELEMVLEDVKPKRKRSPEPDLEVSWETIQAMGDQPEAPGPPAKEEEEGQEEGAGRQEEGPPEEEEEEDRPELQELPESEEEEEEEEAKQEEEVQGGGQGHIAELEGIRLMDTLHLGGYWPVQEGAERRRRPPPKLGVEQERGFWEERLPRELSMGDPGSRQLTPQPSPPALQLDRRHGLRVPAAARLQELGQQRDQCAAAGHDQAAPLQPHMLPPLLPRLGWRGRAGPDGGDPAPKARYQVKGDDESD